jgi:hypothetical protein
MIHFSFQATNEAMAMAAANILAPSTRESNQMYVRPSDDEVYVPEVHYSETNEYGKMVKKAAGEHCPRFPA